MRGFLLKSILFFLPIAVLLFFFEQRLSSVVNAYNFKRTGLERGRDSIRTIILGSSQAAYGIDPILFSEPAFNLAMPSQSLFYDVSLVNNYAFKMTSLKKVIFTISYFSFDYQVIESKEMWRDFYYSQFWGVNYPGLQSTDLRLFSKIALYSADTSLLYLMQGFKINLAKGFSDQGYFKMDTAGAFARINERSGFERVKFHESQMKSKYFDKNVIDLKKIVAKLIQNKIEVIFLTMPLYITYSKNIDPETLKRNADVINDICNQYHIAYLNYSLDNRFNKKDFYDNDHLNFIGAEKLSKIINYDIAKLNNKL